MLAGCFCRRICVAIRYHDNLDLLRIGYRMYYFLRVGDTRRVSPQNRFQTYLDNIQDLLPLAGSTTLSQLRCGTEGHHRSHHRFRWVVEFGDLDR